MSDTQRKLRRKRVLLMAGSFLLTVVAAEVICRCFDLRGRHHEPRADVVYFGPQGITERQQFGYIPFSTVVSTYDSDPRFYFESGNTVPHRFNSLGWRDVEHSVEKPDDAIRILGLGDSYLYGQGVRFEDICFSRQATLLKDIADPGQIELINAAMNASNTVLQSELLRTVGLKYDPDLVILHFVLNDVEDGRTLYEQVPKIEFGVDYIATYDTPDPLSQHSYFWSWARQRYLRTVRSRSYINECLNSFDVDSTKWKRCRNALDEIRQLCDDNDVNLLVVVFPFFIELNGNYPFQPIHDVVSDWCREQGVDVLDLRTAYADYHGPELWVHPTDQHPNEIAHGIAAEAIAQHIREHNDLLVRKRQ